VRRARALDRVIRKAQRRGSLRRNRDRAVAYRKQAAERRAIRFGEDRE